METISETVRDLIEREKALNEIGIALSAEKNSDRLFEQIVAGAKRLTRADGGTLYLVTPEKRLRFAIFLSDTIQSGAESYPDLDLVRDDGTPNEELIVMCAATRGKSIAIDDAYETTEFNFSGTRLFDQERGYRTQSVLAVPMKNHEGELIGVLQLLNAKDPKTGRVVPFSPEDLQLVESLASQGAVALTNQQLIANLKELFMGLTRVIAQAIDEKSPSMGNHEKRVPVLVDLLARAVGEAGEGPLREVIFSPEELYELQIAALLHDCGKITTPVHLIEKKTKLEGVWDRIVLIKARYEIAKRDHPEQAKELEEEFAFVERCNRGEEKIDSKAVDRLKRIVFLTEEERSLLAIPEGNLSLEERKVIQNHVLSTYRLLKELPYPRELKNVPSIAAAHHERMDGRGYPHGLKGEELSLQARILAFADVFEALSAPDRTYRKPLPLSQLLKKMKEMALEGHLDPDLVDVFIHQKVYLRYAQDYLAPEQDDL